MTQPELFPTAAARPEGFVYRADFISPDEEAQLVTCIRDLAFDEVRMHGVVAKRRTVHFGRSYEFQTFQLGEAPPIPEFLAPLRERTAELTAREPEDFGEALVTEYAAGAGIGWHRDAPAFGIVVGISLLAECTMQFRPWPVQKSDRAPGTKRSKAIAQVLAPRSVYVLDGAARSGWQHHIPTTKALRYSVTFRTLRSRGV